MFTTLIIFLIVLGILVFGHELGHFVAAKLCGVKVLEFSIGFPPRIFSLKKGETKYSIGMIPLGGYVQMLGENEESKDKQAFNNQTPGKRFLISVAGVIMNIVLAWLILTIGFAVGMSPLVTAPEKIPGKVLSSDVIVAAVQKDSPAEKAGLKQRDILQSAVSAGETTTFDNFDEFDKYTEARRGQQIRLEIKRDGQVSNYDVLLRDDPDSQLGVSIVEQTIIRVPWYKAPYVALKETYQVTSLTIKLLGQFFVKLFSTGQVGEDVGGPVKIYQYTGLAAKAGFMTLMQFVAMLSINLALINILPIPALDGSKMLFIAIEKIARKKLIKESTENIIHLIGFVLLILLIIAITYKDIFG